MASNTDYLPDEITYGFVADRVLLAVGDTASDDNRFPDGVPAQGTVRFSPERTILYTQQHPATVLPQDIECTIYHRDHPVAKERGYEPELVGKLVDPAGHVGNVALIVGWYDVVYRLSTGTAQRFRFQVRPEHTAVNPLWLPEVAPLQPTPSERFVVNEQVYNDTKTARDEAQTAATDAEAARDLVLPARDQTLAARDQTLALGITVDTSVGTRVFLGDTMIYGDTGWRDISNRLNNGWTGTLLVKRENSLISWKVHNLDGTNATSGSVFSPPAGFQPLPGSVSERPNLVEATSPPRFVRSSAAGAGSMVLYGWETAGRLYGSWTWNTHNDWPTSLPGTPY